MFRLLIWGTVLLAMLIMQVILKTDVVSMWIMIFGVSAIYAVAWIRHYFKCGEKAQHELVSTTSHEEGYSKNPETAPVRVEEGQTWEDNTRSTGTHHLLLSNHNVTDSGELELSSPFLQDASETTYPNTTEPPFRHRLYYLDNLKTALTVLVVTHHSLCALGSCDRAWVLVVGLYSNPFGMIAQVITILDQGYFMPLFFFVSAYLTPTSRRRKGTLLFLVDKTKRLWAPLIFVTFILFPVLFLFCGWVTDSLPVGYLPVPGHGWFLAWLLALNFVYCTTGKEVDERSSGDDLVPFPSSCKRWFYGFTVCGLLMLVLILLLLPHGFATMPISIGSLANDLFLFAAGIQAQKYGWLEPTRTKSIREHLDISPIRLRILVVVEAVVMCLCILVALQHPQLSTPFIVFGGIGVCVSGIYCLDISLSLLEFFQTNMDYTNRILSGMTKAAYTAYLIHPIFIAAFTTSFIRIYEIFTSDKLEFTGLCSSTPLSGGPWILLIGWFGVFLGTQITLWPVAWYLRRLPLLRQIL